MNQLMLLLAATIASNASIAANDTVRFHIPEQTVSNALLEFARQANLSILLPRQLYTNVVANELMGEYPPHEAIRLLLQGTGIVATISEEDAHIVVLVDAPGDDDAGADDAADAVEDDAGEAAAEPPRPAAGARANRTPEIEEIAITGSRIRQTQGMATPVPVTSLTTAELSSFDPGGTMAEQLDALPQFFNSTTAQRNPGGVHTTAGGSYLNMRGIGPARTLILFDGSRVVPADKRGSVNVDTLPTALVRSVDVVTGGASAAYGADALGGVVNFVLDREFEGFEMEAGTGITELGDGFRRSFSLAGGRQFGERLNVIASLQALDIEQIFRDPATSDWYRNWGYVTNPAWSPGDVGVPQRLTLPLVASTEHSPYGMIWARRGNASTSEMHDFALNGHVFLPDGSGVRPFVKGDVYAAPWAPGSTKSMSGGPEGEIRLRAFNDAGAGANVVNRSGFAALRYDFSDNLSGFAQILIGRSESRNKQVRGGIELAGGYQVTIYRDNAFLPEAVGEAMDAANGGEGIDSFQLWRNGGFVENYGKDPSRMHEEVGVHGMYSWSLGFDLILPNDWDLRASWQSGEAHKRTGVYGNYRWDRTILAIDAVRDPASGAIVCNVQLYNPTPEQLAAAVADRLASPGGSPGGTGRFTTTEPLASPIGLDDTIRDCVPYNVFQSGNTPREVVDYIGTPKIGDSVVNQSFAEILLTGELFDGREGPVSFAAGLTYREQDFFDHALPREIDMLGPVVNVPELGIRGAGPIATGGSANLHAFSTLPMMDGEYDVWEWFGELNAPLWSSAVGVQWLGGSVAFRQSNYSSLDEPIDSWKVGLDFQMLEDLRLRVTRSRDVREATFAERFDAQASGISVTDPRFNNEIVAITAVTGGNPALIPESADTVVAGFVYQPRWIEGLSASVDWYKLKIRDSISSLGVQRIVDDCESGVAPQLCRQVQRNADGYIGRIFNVALNVAQYRLEGIDYELSYQMEPRLFDSHPETLNLRLLAGYQIENMDVPYGATTGTNLAGTLNTPDLTSTLTGTYTVGPYGMQLQQRYVAGVILNPQWVEGIDVDDNTAPSHSWTNLRLSYTGERNNGATWSVGLDVTNVLDRHPPIIPSFGIRDGGQLVHANYDIFGRRYQLNFTMSFR